MTWTISENLRETFCCTQESRARNPHGMPLTNHTICISKLRWARQMPRTDGEKESTINILCFHDYEDETVYQRQH